MTRAEKILNIAKAFRNEDPMEYYAETLEQTVESLEKSVSDEFIDTTYRLYFGSVRREGEG